MMDVPRCPTHHYDFVPIGGISQSMKKDFDYQRLFYCGCCDKYVMMYYKYAGQEEWKKKGK